MTKSVTSVKEQSEELNTRSVSNTTGLMFKTTFEVDVEEYDGWRVLFKDDKEYFLERAWKS